MERAGWNSPLGSVLANAALNDFLNLRVVHLVKAGWFDSLPERAMNTYLLKASIPTFDFLKTHKTAGLKERKHVMSFCVIKM